MQFAVTAGAAGSVPVTTGPCAGGVGADLRVARRYKDLNPGDQPYVPYDPYGSGPAKPAPDDANAVREDDRTPFAPDHLEGDGVTVPEMMPDHL